MFPSSDEISRGNALALLNYRVLLLAGEPPFVEMARNNLPVGSEGMICRNSDLMISMNIKTFFRDY